MKKLLPLLLAVTCVHSLSAQYVFPNFSFEDWTDGDPDHWNTNNAFGVTVPVTKSTDAHSGSFAVKGEVTNFNTWTAPNFGSQGAHLFEINQRHTTLNFYYKFNKLNNDVIVVTAQLNTAGGWPVGFINARITANADAYTPIAIPISYLPGDSIPGEMGILIGIQDTVSNTATPGSYFIFDDFALDWFTGLAVEENTFANENVVVYSNPANDVISFSVPEKNPDNTVSVIDITGKQVVKPFNSQTAKTYISSGDLADGIYFLTLQSKEGNRMKKIVVKH